MWGFSQAENLGICIVEPLIKGISAVEKGPIFELTFSFDREGLYGSEIEKRIKLIESYIKTVFTCLFLFRWGYVKICGMFHGLMSLIQTHFFLAVIALVTMRKNQHL